MCTIPGTTTTSNVIGLRFIIPDVSPNPLTVNAQDTVYFKITECTNTTNTLIANIWNNSGNNICYSSGNVGIGITVPTTALHVNGAVTLAGLSSASQSYVLGYNQSTGLVTYQSASAATQWTTSGSNISYNSGSVGIGTNSPQTALDIMGTEYIRDASGTGIIKQGVVYGNGYIQMGLPSSLTAPYTASSAPLYFTNFNAGSTYMSIIPSTNGATNIANIGINTSSPSAVLHVTNGGSNGAQAGIRIQNTSNITLAQRIDMWNSNITDKPTWTLINDWNQGGTNDFRIISAGTTTNGLGVMTMLQNGMVGIGTNNPSYPFHVNSSTVPAVGITGGTDQYLRVNEAYFQYWNANESAVVGVLNSASCLYIRKNGCVGIAIGDPTYKLHVLGGANSVIQNTCASLSSGQYIMWQLGLYDSSSYYSSAQIQYNFIGNGDNRNYLSLGIQNYNWALVVTGKGYIGIGTTAPQFPLDVASSINWSTGYPYQVYSLGMPAGTEQVYSVRASYSFWTFYGGYLSSSDRRKKTNINNADTSSALSKILSLPLKTYNYIDKVADGDELVYGLIAQEVKEIIPEAITLGTAYIPSIYKMATSVELSEDETNVIITIDIPETSELKVGGKVELVVEDMKEKHTTTVVSFTSYELVVPKWDGFDETKNVFVVGPEVNDYHTLDKPYLAVVCMGGIQELSARNDALTERVTALETTNASLQQQIDTLNQLVLSLINK